MTTIQATDILSISIADHNRRMLVTYADNRHEEIEPGARYDALLELSKTWGKGVRVGRFDVTKWTRPAVDPTAPFINPPRPVELYPGAFDYWQRLALAIVQERRTWYPFWGVVCRELQDALKQLVARGYLREIVYKGYVLGNDVRKWDKRKG